MEGQKAAFEGFSGILRLGTERLAYGFLIRYLLLLEIRQLYEVN